VIYWLLERILRRGFRSRRGILPLGELDTLARSNTASLVLAQEKARLEFLAAKEDYEKFRSWRAFERLLERLLQLYSTNAVIQALINEHTLEQLVAKSSDTRDEHQEPLARRCA
jgi:hypothetical protein